MVRHISFGAALICAAAAPLAALAQPSLSPRETGAVRIAVELDALLEQCEASVGENTIARGTGILVDDRGIVLVARHVLYPEGSSAECSWSAALFQASDVERRDSIRISLAGQPERDGVVASYYSASIYGEDQSGRDWLLLVAPGLGADVAAGRVEGRVGVADCHLGALDINSADGHRVGVVGYPSPDGSARRRDGARMLDRVVARFPALPGVETRLRDRLDLDSLDLSAIQGGISGGPVVDLSGQTDGAVIGMLVARDRREAFALPFADTELGAALAEMGCARPFDAWPTEIACDTVNSSGEGVVLAFRLHHFTAGSVVYTFVGTGGGRSKLEFDRASGLLVTSEATTSQDCRQGAMISDLPSLSSAVATLSDL